MIYFDNFPTVVGLLEERLKTLVDIETDNLGMLCKYFVSQTIQIIE